MTDISDRATHHEEQSRGIALANALNHPPLRDMEAVVCNGCNYVTKSNYGKTCESYKDCLADVQRIEKQNGKA